VQMSHSKEKMRVKMKEASKNPLCNISADDQTLSHRIMTALSVYHQ
jgi:hypothetical protein